MNDAEARRLRTKRIVEEVNEQTRKTWSLKEVKEGRKVKVSNGTVDELQWLRLQLEDVGWNVYVIRECGKLHLEVHSGTQDK